MVPGDREVCCCDLLVVSEGQAPLTPLRRTLLSSGGILFGKSVLRWHTVVYATWSCSSHPGVSGTGQSFGAFPYRSQEPLPW